MLLQFKSVDLALDPKPIVDDMVRTMILHQVPGIKRGMLNERDEGGTSRLYLVTEGVNIQVRSGYVFRQVLLLVDTIP